MEVKWPLRHFCSPNHTAELLRKECELKKKKTKNTKTEPPVDRGSEKEQLRSQNKFSGPWTNTKMDPNLAD